MCESAFKLRTIIDHTGHMFNTLNLKLLIKETNSDNQRTTVNELFQVSIDRRFKYRVKGIDVSLSTDTTELSSMNVEYKKQRRSEFDQFHRQSRENWQKQ